MSGTATTLRGPSQCDRILTHLKDGHPHEMTEIHRAIGTCRLNSRIAELRARGHNIVCDKTGGLYRYTLLDATPCSASLVGVPADRHGVASSSGPCDEGCLPDLTLVEATAAARQLELSFA